MMLKTTTLLPVYFALLRKNIAAATDDYTDQQQQHTISLPWSLEQFPSSPGDSTCISGMSARFCDPDSLIAASEKTLLDEALIDSPKNRRVVLPGTCSTSDNDEYDQSVPPVDQIVEVQYAVALMRKMDLQTPADEYNNENPEKAAEVFARQIHDTWGVGIETRCGGTGVLLFLSDTDRKVFLSRGSALDRVLTDRRLDTTIERMKPLLAKQRYGDAVLFAIQEMDAYLLAGEPEWKERVGDLFVNYFGYLAIFGFFGFSMFTLAADRKKRREYAKVESQLGELDRARAEALQGRFQAKSCPICLETFHGIPENATVPPSEANDNDDAAPASPPTGSDGLPLKLLRCGHVFCETCFGDWVSSGHHDKVNKCPICQQDVGKPQEGRSEVVPQSRADEAVVRRGHGRATRSTSSDFDPTASTMTTDDDEQEEQDNQSRAIRQYTRDRNFRLSRLASRYPQYIRPDQIEQWSRAGYDGSLARDPSFVERDPVRQAAQANRAGSSHPSSGGGSSFSGGSSGGGRGGSW